MAAGEVRGGKGLVLPSSSLSFVGRLFGAPSSFNFSTSSTPLQNSAGVPNQGSATPDVMHTPLFTEEQVRDMIMLQSRTPWLYGDRPARSFSPAFRRPSFLEAEEAIMSAESHEMSTMRAYMKERIHALETGFAVPEVDLSFSTPNGSDGSKEAARPPASGRLLDPRRLQDPQQVHQRRLLDPLKECLAKHNNKEENVHQQRQELLDSQRKSLEFMCLMMENMKELQRKYQKEREEGGSIRGIEVVRSGAQELPPLPAWSSNQSPLQLSDWLLLIERWFQT